MFDNYHIEHEELKSQHEKAVVERFIGKYNEEQETNFAFKRRGMPPAPDFEYEDSTTGTVIGIEVTEAYYDETTAKGSWEMARSKVKSFRSSIICNPTEILRRSIEHAIVKKCQKTYDISSPIILVLNSMRPPLHDDQDVQEIEEMVRRVKLPKQIPFHEIYLGIKLGQYRIWRFYPGKSD